MEPEVPPDVGARGARAMTVTEHPIPEDPAVQNRTWTVQRMFWGLFVVVVALGFAGLFSVGPLSDSTAANSSLSINYQGFQRITKQTQYLFHIPAGTEAKLRLNSAFQTAYTVSSILPRPSRSEVDERGLLLTFDKASDTPLLIAIAARPLRIGSQHLSAETAGQPIRFNVFVYP
jgi:hypothetical protein